MQPVPIYTPYQTEQSLSSEVQKCLAGDKGLADLFTKSLQGKEFTEEDTERIADCVAKRIDAKESLSKVSMIIFLALIVAVIILIVAAIIFSIV